MGLAPALLPAKAISTSILYIMEKAMPSYESTNGCSIVDSSTTENLYGAPPGKNFPLFATIYLFEKNMTLALLGSGVNF